eukprot:s255_g24.t1
MFRCVRGSAGWREGAEQVVGPGRAAKEKEEKGNLRVRDSRDRVEELGLPCLFLAQCSSHVVGVADGSAEDAESLRMGRECPVAGPKGGRWRRGLQEVDICGFFASGVPNPGFAEVEADSGMGVEVVLEEVEADSGMGVEVVLEEVEDGYCAVGWGYDIQIVKVREEGFAWLEVRGDCGECCVQGQAEHSRHEWIALFAAIALLNCVGVEALAVPEIRGGGAVKAARDGEEGGEFRVGSNGCQHGVSGDMLVRSHAINTQDRRPGVQLDGRAEGAHQGFCARFVAERAPYPTVGFAEGDEAAQAHGCQDVVGKLGASYLLGGEVGCQGACRFGWAAQGVAELGKGGGRAGRERFRGQGARGSRQFTEEHAGEEEEELPCSHPVGTCWGRRYELQGLAVAAGQSGRDAPRHGLQREYPLAQERW